MIGFFLIVLMLGLVLWAHSNDQPQPSPDWANDRAKASVIATKRRLHYEQQRAIRFKRYERKFYSYVYRQAKAQARKAAIDALDNDFVFMEMGPSYRKSQQLILDYHEAILKACDAGLVVEQRPRRLHGISPIKDKVWQESHKKPH